MTCPSERPDPRRVRVARDCCCVLDGAGNIVEPCFTHLAADWVARENARNADREVENFEAADLEEVRLQDLGDR